MIKSTLFITNDFPPQKGGVGSVYYNICKNIPSDNLVVLAPEYPDAKEFDKSQGFKIIRKKFLNTKKSLPLSSAIKMFFWNFEIAKIVKKYNIKTIQVGQVLPIGTAVMFYAKNKNIDYVVYTHGLDVLLPQQTRRKKILLKKVLQNAKGIVANSYFTHDEIVNLGIDKNKIIVAYPCPNISNIKSLENKKADGKKIILTVSRLVKRKAIDAVIKSVGEIVKTNKDIKYLIIGNGIEKKNLQNLVNKNNLGEFVEFIGKVSDEELPSYYKSCDVFIMPSRRIGPDVEGFGIVFLEANLFGKPVIGGKSGGMSEAIIDGQTGILVDPESISEITSALNKIINDPTYAQQLGMQGMQRVLEEFNWSEQVKKIIPLLQ